ncbi:unnamed protein product [Blepharisma stoltei]|uniref:Uncharacterized protein n=1 Tax=Blepharisma stoltei TaxID=1481888 RepID=A0AAU9J0C3_9CILI|nr:unnamed protein product [Blepharisma stoltei]
MGISAHTKTLKILDALYAVVILVLSGIAYTSICFPENHINEVIDNWKMLSIYDIVTVNSSQSCPFGYDEINRVAQWPGTNEGCYCSYNGDVIDSPCTSSQTKQGCTAVSSTAPFNMRVWRGRVLCVWRGGTSAYWAPVAGNESCPSLTDIYDHEVEFIKCATGEFQLCQESSLGCPINKVLLQNSSDPRPDGYSNSLYFGDDLVLYYGIGDEDSTDLPIIDIAITQGNPCFESESGDSKSYYPLLKETPEECTITDDRFVTIDSLSEESYYQDNDNQDILSLPEFTLEENSLYYLSYRRSILWKKVCQTRYFTREKLHRYDDPLHEVYGLQLALLIVDSIFAFYFIIVGPLLYWWCYRRSEEDLTEFDKPLLTLTILEVFCKILVIPFLLCACVVCGYYRNWYRDLDYRVCSDPLTAAGLKFVDYVLTDPYRLNWAHFGVTLFMLLLQIIVWIMLFVKRTKDNFG